MKQLRPGEFEEVHKLCSTIADLYPNLFEISTYEHPVFGARKVLIFKTWNGDGGQVDIQNITKIEFNLVDRELYITSELPTKIYVIKDFYQMDGVV